MGKVIPIFPLKLVIFPQSSYPLHIFEKRYKKMINRCLVEKTGFGIVSLLRDDLSQIGTYVVIDKVLKTYLTGEMDIIVKGVKRFFIIDHEIHADGYYVAAIRDYKDNPGETDIILIEEMEIKFENLIDKINYKLEDKFWKNYKSSKLKSFKVAEKSGLTLEQQQVLLSMRHESIRITFLIEHFEKLDAMLNENSALKQIVIGDGYIN